MFCMRSLFGFAQIEDDLLSLCFLLNLDGGGGTKQLLEAVDWNEASSVLCRDGASAGP